MTFCPLIKHQKTLTMKIQHSKWFHFGQNLSRMKTDLSLHLCTKTHSEWLFCAFLLLCGKQRNVYMYACCVLHIDTTCARGSWDSTFDIAWKAFTKLQTAHHFFSYGQQQQVTRCTDEKRAKAAAFSSSYYGSFHCFYFPFKVGNEGKMKAQILSFHSSVLLDRTQTVCVCGLASDVFIA